MDDGLKLQQSRGASSPTRCAIYTRKSTEEGLDQDFNSLEAQREAAESYIHSQKHLGWTAIADHYDDGGFSGGNLDRPALQQLLDDIEAQRVDCVVVYKVRPAQPVIARFCPAHGSVRSAVRQLRIGHPAF